MQFRSRRHHQVFGTGMQRRGLLDQEHAYVYKKVAESYNRDGKGIIKMFRSLAKLPAWMNMPAPRMYFESKCNEAEPLPHAQEQTQDELSDDEVSEEYYALNMKNFIQTMRRIA